MLATIAGSQRVTVKDAGAAEAEVVAVDLSLELFGELANLKKVDSSVVERLLSADPREPSKALASLGIDFEAFQKQITAGAGVRPLVLFLRHGADPVEEARRRGISIVPWQPQAPPALLAGREIDTLIVFEPLKAAGGQPDSTSPVARAQVASLAALRSFSLAQDPSGGPLDIRRYWVNPQQWKKSVVFEHTRCEERGPGMTLVTKLTYEGGSTDTSRTSVADGSWSPCKLMESSLQAVVAKQPSRKKAGRGMIVASSYFRAPTAGPVLSRVIEVD